MVADFEEDEPDVPSVALAPAARLHCQPLLFSRRTAQQSRDGFTVLPSYAHSHYDQAMEKVVLLSACSVVELTSSLDPASPWVVGSGVLICSGGLVAVDLLVCEQ